MLALAFMKNQSVNAFTSTGKHIGAKSFNLIGQLSLTMVGGGRGWENDGFLDNLGGDKNEEERAQEQQVKYEQFREQKAKMDEMRKKQEEFFKTEQGQKFLQGRQSRDSGDIDLEIPGGDIMGQIYNAEDLVGSGGGSRFQTMMRRAERGNILKNSMNQQGLDLFDFENEDQFQ